MTKKEKETLREAARIIERELAAGRKVRVPSFGEFYTTKVLVFVGIRPDETDEQLWDSAKTEERTSVRLRTFRSFFRRFNQLPDPPPIGYTDPRQLDLV